MPSFDVESKLEWPEVDNALNQAERELTQRFDFKGTGARVEKTEGTLVVSGSSDERVKAAWEVVREKLVRRKVSLKHFEADKPGPGPKGTSKMTVRVTEGIDPDKARELIKLIKDTKLKVQASIQGDTLRVTGKKRDDLQDAISAFKQADIGIELQFRNFRD